MEARKVLARANLHFKDKEPDLKEERLLLLENWLQIEQKARSDQNVIDDVKAKFPKRVKKRRKIKVIDTATGKDETNAETANQDGDEGWEEYFDYVFPEDGPTGPSKNLKILQMAHKWKENAN